MSTPLQAVQFNAIDIVVSIVQGCQMSM